MVILKRLLLVSMSLMALGLIGWCAVSEYTIRTMSPSVVLGRLAGVTDGSASDATLRQALLERIPVGTQDTDIIALLEAHGIERDRFTGGQLFRYQMHDNSSTILALLSTPTWIINFPCGPSSQGVRFTLDGEHKLRDILIEDYTRCL